MTDDDLDDGERPNCWKCNGDGGWHDCGEDFCPCAAPTLNVVCDICGGRGFIS